MDQFKLNEDLTLKEIVEYGCKHVDIGTAILPKPLFVKDWDEYDDDGHDGHDGMNEDGMIPPATIDVATTFNDTSTSSRKTTTTTQYSRVVEREFNAIVIEHHLKWSPLCYELPGPNIDGSKSTRLGRYDFYHVDQMVDWALARNIKVKGHVLVWHVTSPVELLEPLTPHQVKEELKRHIYTTMGHFKGRIKVWDVVNEALAPDGTLADTIFLRKLGPSYIEDAFRWAHDADPTAILLYNDNKVEGGDVRKSEAFYNLLRDLVLRGVPIHGAGMQAHINAAGNTPTKQCPTPTQIKQQIHRIGKLGLKVNISEMDVRVNTLPFNVQQLAQRDIYQDLIAAAISEPACDGIWFWGFSDRHTWVTNFYSKDEHPCIFDEHYDAKNAYYGVQQALQQTLLPYHNAHNTKDNNKDNDGDKPWGYLWRPTIIQDATKASGDGRPDWLQSE